jgi:hypothetical protein
MGKIHASPPELCSQMQTQSAIRPSVLIAGKNLPVLGRFGFRKLFVFKGIANDQKVPQLRSRPTPELEVTK